MNKLTDKQKTQLFEAIKASLANQDFYKNNPQCLTRLENMGGEALLFEFSDFVPEPFKMIHHLGGGEGGTEYCELVFRWPDNGTENELVKIVYSYRSYDGYDFSYAEFFWVTPKEKVVTVYE